MQKRRIAKLAAQCGESMVEALAACLIIAVSISMLAGVMVASARVLQKTRAIQENNDNIMQEFWRKTDTEANEGQDDARIQPVSVDFDGFSIQVDLYATEIDQGDLKGTVYEFRPISTP